jgi:CheY-like chemotaxis protein
MEPTNPRCVLVVDNEPAVLQVVGLSLQRHGFSVLTVPSAEEALSICCDSPPVDAVVTDVEMEPGKMNGLQLAASLRARNPCLLILVVSGSLEAGDAARERGFPFLAKPFTPLHLMRMLDELQTRAAPPT